MPNDVFSKVVKPLNPQSYPPSADVQRTGYEALMAWKQKGDRLDHELHHDPEWDRMLKEQVSKGGAAAPHRSMRSLPKA